ncbi:uroporphyrinogen-III synthase [Promicromonospora panici]|uniref:uroporphyrinogen-III synthase n=1 Tax=Promicromonospora panici TaxID=2219658 RepID=UPI00101DE802|nr:uroporphyrinogen-III synthase [Promicromonospora panici]
MTEQVPPTAGLHGPAVPPAVLVARAPERASGLLALLRERGLDPVAAPVIERAPVEDPAELDAARARLADGAYAWVVITSVNAVYALLGARISASPSATPPHDVGRTTWWAAVGPATQRALARYDVAADLVPETASAAGLAAGFPRAAQGTEPRVLLPLGDLASDTLRTELEAKGWTVDVVTAYRTVARELPEELRRRYDVVVVASGSAARQVAAQLGPQRVVAIGEPSAGTARAVGHTVLAVAEHPTDEALATAVTQALAVGAIVAPKPGT